MSEPGSSIRRNVNYDFMRIVMFLYVVALHTTKCSVLNDNLMIRNLLDIFFFQCNAVFFMISGILNLNKKFETTKDYYQYYIKRIKTVILPYILVFAIIMFAEHHVHRGDMPLREYFVFMGKALVQNDVYSHLWFLYTLIGFMISTPFLSKMLHAMKDEELKLLFIGMILWNLVSIYLCTDLGISMGVNGWLFSGWIWAYLTGFIIVRLKWERFELPIYLLGLVGYIVSVLGRTYIPGFANSADLSVGFMLFAIASFCFMKQRIKIGEKIGKTVSFFGKHAFTAYIINIYFMGHLTKRIVDSESGVGQWLCSLLVTFTTSLTVAAMLDLLIVGNVFRIIAFCTEKGKNNT